ncbi:hypothetical protein, partial [Spirosoma jeollabukense]
MFENYLPRTSWQRAWIALYLLVCTLRVQASLPISSNPSLSGSPVRWLSPMALTFTDLNTSPFTALQFGARRIFFDADGDGDLDML